MSVSLAVIQPNPLQQCRRCGSCCEHISLSQSPAKLREQFDKDQQFNNERGTDSHDIRTIYAMLRGRCRGKMVWGGEGEATRYVKFIYGPCANLGYEGVDGQKLAKCKLHGQPEKPYLCTGYPFYAGDSVFAQQLNKENPGYMRGCGYNLDPTFGTELLGDSKLLWDLEPDEMEPLEEVIEPCDVSAS